MNKKEITKSIYVDKEIFKPINYPRVVSGLYYISNFGRCYSVQTGIYLKGEIDKDGYIRVRLKVNDGRSLHFGIHRLVAWEFTKGYNPDYVVNHLDTVKNNNYYRNLEWTTVKENTRHASSHGLIPIGINHHKNKYPESFIIKICELIQMKKYKQGQIYKLIESDVPKGTSKIQVIDLIKRIRSRKTWREISCNYKW